MHPDLCLDFLKRTKFPEPLLVPSLVIKGQLTRQVGFDELTSFSGQSSLSDDFMVAIDAKVKPCKATMAFIKAKKASTKSTIAADVHSLPPIFVEDNDDPWLIYDLNSYLESKAANLALFVEEDEDQTFCEDFQCFHITSAFQ